MKVAVLGATGAVGRTMLQVLDERAFPVDELVPLASERSRGQVIRWQGRDWTVDVPSPAAFRGVDIALFSAGGSRSSSESRPTGAQVRPNGLRVSSPWRTSGCRTGV